MEAKNARVRSERGQTLILFVLGLAVLLGFVAMTIDVGLAFMERRSLQNAVDAAALAAAHDFVDGASEATARATAIDYVQRHGFSAPAGDIIEVNIPPTSGPYAGLSGYVEVKASSEAPPAFVLLFLDAPYTLSARSVAQGISATESSSGGGVGGGAPVPVPSDVSCGGPTVDGRVTSGDGYTKIGDLGTGATDYGDIFVACDVNFYYFAMRLNGPDTGGAVANDNVYMCRTDSDCGGGIGELQAVVAQLQAIVDSNPGTPLADKVEDALAKVQTAVAELAKAPPDNPAALGSIEGAIGDLEAAIGLDPIQDPVIEGLIDQLTQWAGLNQLSPTYHSDFATGWADSGKKRHSYRDLLKSDRARFQIVCGATIEHDFILDYLIETGSGWKSDVSGDGSVNKAAPTDSATSLEWNLEHPVETGWGDDPGEYPLIQSPPFNPTWPDYDSEYDGWVWEMIYEFRVPKQPLDDCTESVLFGLYDISGSAGGLAGIHSSPGKTEDSAFVHIQTTDGTLKLVE